MSRESFITKQERIGKIIFSLKVPYPDAHCELIHSNPLQLLIATILSAQCSDKQVNLVTENLFKIYRTARDFAEAPIPDLEKPVSVHNPYSDGDCSICHQHNDRKDPGPIKKHVNDLCLDCHDDFAKIMARKATHEPAKINCVTCHSPHNSRQPHLLVEEPETLCLSCHTAISNLVTNAKVKHDALSVDHKCANCHNPHAANVQHLLTRLPYDQIGRAHV